MTWPVESKPILNIFWKSARPERPHSSATYKNLTEIDKKTDKDLAETLHSYFARVFIKAENIELPTLPEKQIQHLLDNIVITEELFKKEKVDPNKTPGSDNIHPKLIHS